MEEKGNELIITCMPSDLEIVRNYGKEKLDADLFLPLAVIDRGNGISEEQMGKIFLPFYSTKKTGTGLGLAIVQRIVTNLNGRIECKSKPGRGTAFTVYLHRYHGVKKEVAQVS